MDYCDNEKASHNCESFFLAKIAAIIPTISGSISVISSVIAMTVIFRSQIRLSSVYHRIIFGMSVSDTIGSIAMALTTIPMPTDQIYPFEGGMIYGTTTTCEIQGFAYVFGIGGSYFYNCGLCFFYLCIIKFRCSDQKIRRYVEPTIHLLGLVVTSIGAVVFLLLKMYNPLPYETWCSVSPYPWDCSKIDGVECIRGGGTSLTKTVIILIYGVILLLGMTNVLICMGLILREASNNNQQNNARNSNESWISTKKKTLEKQALMYIASFLILWISPTILLFFSTKNEVIIGLKLVFIPLQGFFNTSIFLYHKVHNIRMSDSSVNIRQALYYVLVTPLDTPEINIVIGIGKVDTDLVRKENRGNIHSENGSVAVVSKDVAVEGFVGNDAVFSSGKLASNSRDVNFSGFSLSEREVSFMFDIDARTKDSVQPMEQLEANNDKPLSHISSQDSSYLTSNNRDSRFEDDSGLSFSQGNELSQQSNTNLSADSSNKGIDLSSLNQSGGNVRTVNRFLSR